MICSVNVQKTNNSKAQSILIEAFINKSLEKTKAFFSSYRQVFNRSVCTLSLLGAVGYYTGMLNAHIYRPLVLGTALSSMVFDSADVLFSSMNIDLIDKKNLNELFHEIDTQNKIFEKKVLKYERWKLNNTFERKMLAITFGCVGLALLSLAVVTARVAAETFVCPELLLPRITVALTKMRIDSLVREIRYTHDDTVLKDFENERYTDYESFEGCDKFVSALRRLGLRDRERFKKLTEQLRPQEVIATPERVSTK